MRSIHSITLDSFYIVQNKQCSLDLFLGATIPRSVCLSEVHKKMATDLLAALSKEVPAAELTAHTDPFFMQN
jgi:hypothetical protein